MEQVRLTWPEEASAWARQGLLLLVAVEPGQEDMPPRALPCRVVGSVSPGCPAFPVQEAPMRPDVAEESRRVVGLLGAIGVPTNLLGCAYLRTALLYVLENPGMRRGMMRGLYPQVASAHGVTARSVERAIRHAIAQTWARGGGERCRRLMGRMGSVVGDRPTNGELITLLADHLAMMRDAGGLQSLL